MTDKSLEEMIIDRMMTQLGDRIGKFLNRDPEKPTVGFVLIVLPLDANRQKCYYTSNTLRRQDLIALMKEQLAQLEGMPYQEGNG